MAGEEDSCEGGGGGGDGGCHGGQKRDITSCLNSGDMRDEITNPQSLPRFETDQCYRGRKKFVKTTCEYEVEYFPHPGDQGYSVERKGYPSDKQGYADKIAYPCSDPADLLIPRRYPYNESLPPV